MKKSISICTLITTLWSLGQAPAIAQSVEALNLENQTTRQVVELPEGYIENSRETKHNVFIQRGETRNQYWLDPGQRGVLKGFYDPASGKYTATTVPPNYQAAYRRALAEGVYHGWIRLCGDRYAVVEVSENVLAQRK
jgi:hypothetical protein